MDVLDHLTQEHRKAEQLMEQLSSTDPGSERDRLLDELTDALSTHMAVEERFLYPLITEVLDTETETEAEVEHGLARDGLAKLDELRDQPGFGAALDMLQAGVKHHVEEEESEIFPHLREGAPDELARLDPEELEAEVRAEAGEVVAGGTGKAAVSDAEGLTKAELYERAQEADIPGRSNMTKDELAQAVADEG